MNPRSIINFIGRWTKYLLSFSLTALFVLLVTVLILGYSLENTLLEPSFYDRLLQQKRVALFSRGWISNLVMSYAVHSGHGTYLGDVSITTWEKVAEAAFPIDWVEGNLQAAAETMLLWLKENDTQFPDFSIDLSPVIRNLQGPNGALIILPLFQNIPNCPPDVEKIIYFAENTLVSCLPSPADLTHLARVIADFVADSTPDMISFNQLYAEGILQEGTIQTMDQIRSGIHLLENGLTFGFRVSILVLCLIALLHSSSIPELLRALSKPLYIAGAFILILFSVWHVFIRWGLKITLTSYSPNIEGDAQTLLVEVVRLLGKMMADQWLYWALYLIGAGLVLRVLLFGFNRMRPRLTPETEEQVPKRRRVRKQFR